MRRTLASGLLTLALAAALLPAQAANAQPVALRSLPSTPAPTSSVSEGERALETVEQIMAGEESEQSPDLSSAMATLTAHLDTLGAADRARATKLLAPPTSRAGTENSRNIGQRQYRTCNNLICVHWDAVGPDASTPEWISDVLRVMTDVWDHHVNKLGYRAPRKDGTLGGDNRFDVYVANIGTTMPGTYGYCAAHQQTLKPKKRVAAAYCALDNNYTESYFLARQTPLNTLRVTAAHEFFHAIQYSYDVFEDSWFKESTATWVEERYANDVNDNRMYLRYSPLNRPQKPLDSLGAHWYGGWAFFEFLSSRHGNKTIRQIWQKAQSRKNFSVKAIAKVLKGKRGGFPANFARFASHNTDPARFYREGSAWPTAKVHKSKQVRKGGKKKRTARFTGKVKQLSSNNFRIKVNPKGLKKGKKTRKRNLIIQVSGPVKAKSPAAHALIYKKNGKVSQKRIKLNKRGNGKVKVRVGRGKVTRVVVSVVNASTRFKKCTYLPGETRSCGGKPRDKKVKFVVRATLQK